MPRAVRCLGYEADQEQYHVLTYLPSAPPRTWGYLDPEIGSCRECWAVIGYFRKRFNIDWLVKIKDYAHYDKLRIGVKYKPWQEHKA